MDARLVAGDCVEMMRGLPAGCAALTLADGPYGMGYVSSRTTHRVTTRKIAGDDGFDPEFQTAWLREAYRATRDGGALYAFTDDQHLGDLRACVAEAGWHLKRSLVWLKDGWTVGDLSGDYGHQTEFVVFAHKGRHLLRGPRESNVLRFPRVPPAQLKHTSEKPVALLAHLIRKSTDRGDLVLDPFAGIASAGVAAVANRRGYVGAECDEAWLPEARRRLAEVTWHAHPDIAQAALFSAEAVA